MKPITDTYLANVLLLCVECRQPIKAVITTERWIKCEWISPEGDCRACYQTKKEQSNVDNRVQG